MTTNYHTPVASNAPLNAATIETPLSALDSAITNLSSGGTALTGLNLGLDTTLIMAGGVVTRTRPRHSIDTEAAAATGNLTTINGGTEGDVLLISGISASRVVTVKHGTGNINLFGNLDVVLDDVRKIVTLMYDGSRWSEISGLPTRALTYNGLRLPSGMPIRSALWGRNLWGGKAAAAVLSTEGTAAPTSTGTVTASNDTDSSYINYASGIAATNPMGITSATFNLVRRQHNPKFSMILRIVDITAIRLWIGLFSAAPTTVDVIAGATEMIGYRFSTVAGDTTFIPCTKDATTQTTGGGTVAVAAATRYLLQMELDNTNGQAIFTVNNGAPTVITSTLPAAATELGFAIQGWTTAAVAKNFKLSRFVCEYD